MYKLFLTFRYLTRKKIVIFPILVVWLCVMMLIIVTSIMGGFVDRVRDANRDLYGDIIISSASSSQGFAGYDELSKALKKQFKEVDATTPVVEAYALLYVGGDVKRSVPALLVGIDPVERSKVSKFRESLFQQYQAPTQAVEDLAPHLPATSEELVKFAGTLKEEAEKADDRTGDAFVRMRASGTTPHYAVGRAAWLVLVAAGFLLLLLRAGKRRDPWGYLLAILFAAGGATIVIGAVVWPVKFPHQFEVAEDASHQAIMALYRAERTESLARALPAGNTYKTREELTQALVPAQPTFTPPAGALNVPPGAQAMPQDGCIVGSQIGFYKRDTRGNFVHRFPDFYPRVSITVFPPSESGAINVKATNAVTTDFTIIDDSHTGVYDVDALNVYAPLKAVQVMAGMAPDPKLANVPEAQFDARVHQILIRLNPDGQAHMREMRANIDEFVQQFMGKYSFDHPGSMPADMDVQTWDEKQARYLGAVENEKSMMTFILGLMSLVVLVVIFLIFYQIVRDKTRDIGIIKAVGGSELGVAGIFLSYGLMIGIVGGGLGALTGWAFVIHTNEIHEWIFQTTGLIIWDRSVYLFDRIPDVVRFSDVVLYFCVALVAGVVGSLIPAIIAAFEDPVQAVRYE